MDLTKLREAEDKGVNAVKDLPDSAKWAALETLTYNLNLRITQVDMAAEKLKAFRKEQS